MTYYVDLDNTFFDIQSAFAKKHPNYNPKMQTSYSLPKYLLDNFTSPSFYLQWVGINYQVLDFLVQEVTKGEKVFFYSHCINDEIRNVKELMLLKYHSVFKNKLIVLNDEADYSDFVRRVDDTGVIFIDDANHRLQTLKEEGARFIKMEHPYNRDIYHGRTLAPNYML